MKRRSWVPTMLVCRWIWRAKCSLLSLFEGYHYHTSEPLLVIAAASPTRGYLEIARLTQCIRVLVQNGVRVDEETVMGAYNASLQVHHLFHARNGDILRS
jgi:hypothetical protein